MVVTLVAALVGATAFGLATAAATGVIEACVNNSSGTIKIVSTTTQCSNNEIRLVWNSEGVAGQPGPTGPQGIAGPTGAQGIPGTVSSFNDMNGLPCTIGGVAGVMSLSFSGVGTATLTCVLPPPPVDPTLISDGLNNVFATASSHTSNVSCGSSVQWTGTTFPMGTEDWLMINWTAGGTCTHMVVTFTTTDNLHYELWTASATRTFSGTASSTLTTPGSVIAAVIGNPTSGGSYTG
ncbi:MAG: collagen-like protein, partial [Chloroflexota bacterium]